MLTIYIRVAHAWPVGRKLTRSHPHVPALHLRACQHAIGTDPATTRMQVSRVSTVQ